jgi:hypothetical protein
MQVMQDLREPSAGRNQASARYVGLEARGVAEMPIVQERSLRAAGSHWIKLTQQRASLRLTSGSIRTKRGERQVLPRTLDERECEQSKTGSGDGEEETVRNDLIMHGAPIITPPIGLDDYSNGTRSICANASAECRRALYLKHRPIGLHLCDTGRRARGRFHRSPRRRLRGLG